MKFSLARNSEAISYILLLAELLIHRVFLQFFFFLEYTRTVYIWPCHFLQALNKLKLK